MLFTAVVGLYGRERKEKLKEARRLSWTSCCSRSNRKPRSRMVLLLALGAGLGRIGKRQKKSPPSLGEGGFGADESI